MIFEEAIQVLETGDQADIKCMIKELCSSIKSLKFSAELDNKENDDLRDEKRRLINQVEDLEWELDEVKGKLEDAKDSLEDLDTNQYIEILCESIGMGMLDITLFKKAADPRGYVSDFIKKSK